MSKTIRGIDEDIFRRFKARAKSENRTIGEAVTEAMVDWLDQGEKVSLSEFDSWDWGEETEKLSEEFEDDIYGNTA